MGTRSRIGLALGPDQIISVYCHFDGYIQGNGRDLLKHYNTKEQVENLINGGDMSSLHTTHMWESQMVKRIIVKKDDDGETYKEVIYLKDDNQQYMYSPVKEYAEPLYYSERERMRRRSCQPSMTSSVIPVERNGAICSPLVMVGSVGSWDGVTKAPQSMI